MQDQGSHYASTPGVYSLYELSLPSGSPAPPVLAYCRNIFMIRTKTQKKVVHRIVEVELWILCFGAFFRAVRIGPMKQLSFSRVIDKCDGRGAPMMDPDAMIKGRVVFGILRSIDRMDVDPALPFVAVARLCEVDWHILWSHDLFSFEYRTEKCLVLEGWVRWPVSWPMVPRRMMLGLTLCFLFIARSSLSVVCHSSFSKRLRNITWKRCWIILARHLLVHKTCC